MRPKEISSKLSVFALKGMNDDLNYGQIRKSRGVSPLAKKVKSKAGLSKNCTQLKLFEL